MGVLNPVQLWKYVRNWVHIYCLVNTNRKNNMMVQIFCNLYSYKKCNTINNHSRIFRRKRTFAVLKRNVDEWLNFMSFLHQKGIIHAERTAVLISLLWHMYLKKQVHLQLIVGRIMNIIFLYNLWLQYRCH